MEKQHHIKYTYFQPRHFTLPDGPCSCYSYKAPPLRSNHTILTFYIYVDAKYRKPYSLKHKPIAQN